MKLSHLRCSYYEGSSDSKSPQLQRRVVYPTPRQMDPQLANQVTVVVYKSISDISGIDVDSIKKETSTLVDEYLDYFKLFVPISLMNLSDQYFFDINLFASHLVAARVIPKSEDRVKLRRNIAENILNIFLNEKTITLPMRRRSSVEEKNSIEDFVSAAFQLSEGINNILTRFQSSRFIDSFTFDDEDLSDADYVRSSYKQVRASCHK